MLHKKPRIAVFSLAFEPFESGAEIALREIIKRSSEYSFVVFTYRFDASSLAYEVKDNLTLIRLGRGNKTGLRYGLLSQKVWYIFAAVRKALRFHRQEPFQMAWASMASYGGIAAFFFKKFYPTMPFLLTIQEGDSEHHLRFGKFFMVGFWGKRIMRLADYIQVISRYLKEFVIVQGATAPVRVVPNGIALEKFPETLPSLRHFSDTNPAVLITTSRLVLKNGIDILLQAVAEVKKRGEKVVVKIIGDGPERKNLEVLTASLGLQTEVVFVGQIGIDRIPEELSRADIFVRPSRSEGLGISFLEAMAAGVPVVATEVGGIADFLKNGETGLVTRVDDPHDVADQIIRMLKDDKLRLRLRENARRLVWEKYQWKEVAESMRLIFNQLLNSQKILITTGIFPPAIGGSATWSALIREALSKDSYTINVLTYGEGKDKDGVFYVSQRFIKGFRHFLYFRKLLRLGRRHDFIFAADSSFGAAFVSAVASRWIGKKFFIRVTGDYAWEQGVQRFGVKELPDEFQTKRYGLKVELLRWFEIKAAGLATALVVPSAYLKKIVQSWRVPEEKIRIIYNGISQVSVHQPKEEARQLLGLKGSVIISAGRFVPWKGFKKLIEIFPDILKVVPQATLVLVGDGPEKQALVSEAGRLGLGGRIIFTGSLNHSLLGTYLSAADVFVLNTGYEGLSHQIIEAMSYGLPIVTTMVGGNPELIQSEKNGLLVGYDDVDGLRRSILRILNDSALALRLREAGRVSSRLFSETRMVEAYKDFLDSFSL